MTSSAPEPPRYPKPAAGLALFLGVVACLSALRFLPETVFFIASPTLILGATVVAVFLSKVDPKATLLLRVPSAADLLMAIPLTISIFILEDQIAALLNALFPIPEAVLESSRRLITAETPGEWAQKIAILGVGAALSEELMFRGFMQTAFVQGTRRSAAILLTAVLFTALHFPYASVLFGAIVLGSVALATRSIVVPMLVHFCNNIAIVLLYNLGGLESLGDPVWLPATILVPGAVMFALSWGYYLRRLGPDPSTPTPAATATEQESERITIAHEPRPLVEELAAISSARRRLGWFVVGTSVVGGMLVLVALFGWSVYFIYPERVNARVIVLMERHVISQLEPAASEKASKIESAFRALEALNDSGQLELSDLAPIARAYSELDADRVLDGEDADALVETIRVFVMERTSPRAF